MLSAHAPTPFPPFWSRAYSRAELACIGFHYPPIAGIDFVGRDKGGKGCPPVRPAGVLGAGDHVHGAGVAGVAAAGREMVLAVQARAAMGSQDLLCSGLGGAGPGRCLHRLVLTPCTALHPLPTVCVAAVCHERDGERLVPG